MSQNQKTEICLSLTIEDRELKKLVVIVGLGLGLWYLMPLSTKFQFYRSVLLVEETGVLGENHRPVACH
jgi:hypothetical protein